MSLNARSEASMMRCFSPSCFPSADLQLSVCFQQDNVFESPAITHIMISAQRKPSLQTLMPACRKQGRPIS